MLHALGQELAAKVGKGQALLRCTQVIERISLMQGDHVSIAHRRELSSTRIAAQQKAAVGCSNGHQD